MGPAAIGGQKLSLPEKFPDTMEEPKAPSEALRVRVPRGWGLGRDAVAPPRLGVWGSRKIFIFNVQIYAFLCSFCVKQYAESDDILPLKYRVGNPYSVLSIFLVGIFVLSLGFSSFKTRIPGGPVLDVYEYTPCPEKKVPLYFRL